MRTTRIGRLSDRATANVDVARDPITVLIVCRHSTAARPMPARLSWYAFLDKPAIVASLAGRLVADVTAAGGEFVPLDVGTNNPIVMLRNAAVLNRLTRERQCDAIHAFGRAGA